MLQKKNYSKIIYFILVYQWRRVIDCGRCGAHQMNKMKIENLIIFPK